MPLRRGAEDLSGKTEREIFQRLGAVARQQVRMAHAPLLDAGGETLTKFFSAEGHMS
jgi:hypothetical protein